LHKGILYVVVDQIQDGNRREAQLQARDPKTGRLLWSRWLGGTNAYTAPTIAHGLVYVASDAYGGPLFAFDAKTGRQVWAVSTGEEIRQSPPAVRDGVLYLAVATSGGIGEVQARSAATGELLWHSQSGYYEWAAVTLGKSLLYVGNAFGIEAYSYTDCNPHHACHPVWHHYFTESVRGPADAAVAHGTVYLGFPNQTFYALDASTGETRWTWTWPDNVNAADGTSAPTVANGVVYVGTDAGDAVALDASGCGAPTCEPLWSVPGPSFPSAITAAPVVVNGTVYVVGGPAIISAYRLPRT
jgi:outer membrane protein assembly factor BamB